MPRSGLRRDGLPFTIFLGALSALPPLAIDMGLPGIPAIETTFPDAAGRGALTLSLFLAGFAASPLCCGPLADRFGRRATLLVGLVAFMAAALACTAAPTFPLLLVARLCQGFAAGACVIMPLAIVRDVFHGATARHHLSRITAVLGLAPMLAPILGGWLMTVTDWRGIYAAQGACGLVLLAVTAFGFAETLPAERRRALHPRHLAAGYATVLSDRSFRRNALLYAFGFAAMFSFISGSPAVLMGQLGLSGQTFSLLFALTSCGTLVGSVLSGWLVKHGVPSRRLLRWGVGDGS